MKHLHILLADDHPILLSGLVNFLHERGFTHVQYTENGSEAWSVIKESSPEICILDIEMPGLTGLEILERCKREGITSKIILLSYHTEPEFVALARKKGVAGYIGKENSIKEIEDCIYRVHKDGYYFPNNLIGENISFGKDMIRVLSVLTNREREVLSMVLAESANRDIARILGISLRTVEKHRSNIINKLEINKKPENLTQWALRNKTLLEEVV